MNDFGTFKVIEQTILGDGFLNEKISGVVTHSRPGMKTPYVRVTFNKSKVDLLCAIRSALVECDVTIISNYCGEMEIQDLMSRIDLLLQSKVHEVQSRSLDAPGRAVFKRLSEKKIIEESVRKGTLSYQIKITMMRENQNER